MPRGFALVEALVATLVIAVATLGVVALQLAAFRGGGLALELLAAGSAASSHAERLRALHELPSSQRLGASAGGPPQACRGPRRCTRAEFARDAAEQWSADVAHPRWAPHGPRVLGAGPPDRFGLRIDRDGAPWVVLEVES